jgi:hypothetical protein
LKKLAARPSVTIQVVPFERGPYPGMQRPFVLLEFADRETDPDLLFREDGRDSVATRNDPRMAAEFGAVFDRLSAIATEPEELAEFLNGRTSR